MAEFVETRRRRLLGAVASLGIAAPTLAIRRALAAAERTAGLYRIEGEARLNGRAALPGQAIRPGDLIETGERSQAVFVVGSDAYLLREGGRIETAGSDVFIAVLRVATGKLLSVLGSGAKRIETPTAIIGIRGTGVYVEAQPERTYVCVCYGTADLRSRDRPDIQETVSTQHHEQPRYIYSGESKPVAQMMGKAPVVDHSDAELILLESLVGRTPPFVGSGKSSYKYP